MSWSSAGEWKWPNSSHYNDKSYVAHINYIATVRGKNVLKENHIVIYIALIRDENWLKPFFDSIKVHVCTIIISQIK